MKYINIIKAQAPMQQITKLKLPIKENKKSRLIYKMALDIKEIVDYLQQEQFKIIEKYKGMFQQDGSVSFGNDKDGVDRANACMAEIQALENMDVEWNYDKITLSTESLGEADDFTLSPEEIFYLEGFIEFED